MWLFHTFWGKPGIGQYSARRIWKNCGCSEWAWRSDGNTQWLGIEATTTKSWPMIWSACFRRNLRAPSEEHFTLEGTTGLVQWHLPEDRLLSLLKSSLSPSVASLTWSSDTWSSSSLETGQGYHRASFCTYFILLLQLWNLHSESDWIFPQLRTEGQSPDSSLGLMQHSDSFSFLSHGFLVTSLTLKPSFKIFGPLPHNISPPAIVHKHHWVAYR